MKEDKAKREIQEMLGKQYCYDHGEPETIKNGHVDASKDSVSITTSAKTRYHYLSRLQQELTKYQIYVHTEEIEVNNNYRNPELNTNTMDTNTELAIETTSAATGTLTELRNILLSNIGKIADGTLSLDKAREIVSHSHAIVNISKLELDFTKLKRNAEREALKK